MDCAALAASAKQILNEQYKTICYLSQDEQLTSQEQGIKTLLCWVRDGKNLSSGALADKVVGKAAALLAVKLRVKILYAEVISIPALDLLRRHHVQVTYQTLASQIINRAGDGFCPMEQAVLGETDADAAYEKLTQKCREMGIV